MSARHLRRRAPHVQHPPTTARCSSTTPSSLVELGVAGQYADDELRARQPIPPGFTAHAVYSFGSRPRARSPAAPRTLAASRTTPSSPVPARHWFRWHSLNGLLVNRLATLEGRESAGQGPLGLGGLQVRRARQPHARQHLRLLRRRRRPHGHIAVQRPFPGPALGRTLTSTPTGPTASASTQLNVGRELRDRRRPGAAGRCRVRNHRPLLHRQLDRLR